MLARPWGVVATVLVCLLHPDTWMAENPEELRLNYLLLLLKKQQTREKRQTDVWIYFRKILLCLLRQRLHVATHLIRLLPINDKEEIKQTLSTTSKIFVFLILITNI